MAGGSASWTRRVLLSGLAAAPAALVAGNRAFGNQASGNPTFGSPAFADAASALQSRIKGVAIARGEPRYELWRQAMIWQHNKISRQPDLLVQVESADDVIAAINFAREKGIKVTTRCGGHSLSACFMRQGGMLIDVSRLDGIVVDKASGVASVGPGVFGAALTQRLSQDGLAFPVAHTGMVPISGFLLGGGIGLNANGWSDGVSTLSIKAVNMVTADGVLRHVSADENPDLFWAVRGGGPGLFGVVTHFHLQCRPAPAVVSGVTYTFRLADLVEVARALNEIAPALDQNVEIMAVVAKGSPDLVKGCVGAGCDQLVYLRASAFAPAKEDGQRMLAALLGHPITKRAIAGPDHRDDSLGDYFTVHDRVDPHVRQINDNVFVDDPVAAAEVLARNVPHSPSSLSVPLLLYKGQRSLPDTAYSVMGRFYLGYYVSWTEPEDEAANRKYALDVFRDLKPLSKGSYINELNQEDRPQDVPSCYAPAAWARLGHLRAIWDPRGVFHTFYGQA